MNNISTLETYIRKSLKYGIDEDEDLKPYIEEGIGYFSKLTQTEIDFENNNFAKSLLRDYVRYAVNNSVEYFEQNFNFQILRLQLLEGVNDLESK